ncbi:hypothetical protein Salpa_4635 [Sporomusa sp. KB1]|nr:hypothetical protein Salpa_4635 [Sporomusa sp. KB1]
MPGVPSGGKRPNVGRKRGSATSDRTAQFTKRIIPAEKTLLEEYLNKLRGSKND